MTLLIATFAAVITGILWYTRKDDTLSLGFLALMYTGASLMWLVDAFVEYLETGAEAYFHPAAADMANDAFLGLSVVAFGLIIWLAVLLVKDPRGRFTKAAGK